MAGTQPLSWKWKLTIAFIVLFIAGIAFVFMPFGHDKMKDWIDSAYHNTPAEQRRESNLAEWYLTLAWWRGVVCFDREGSMRMYREFLAIDPKDGLDFWSRVNKEGRKAFNGYFDAESKTGWGILHPKAPDVYYRYLIEFDRQSSKQLTTQEALRYAELLYRLHILVSPEQKPHPRFYVYWDTIRQRLIDPRFGQPPNIAPRPEGWAGPED